MPLSNFFVLDDYKLVSMGIPKCGQTSIKRAFLGNVYNVHYKEHLNYLSFENLAQDIRDLRNRGYLTFTFVRNPYERLVSFWVQKVQHPNKFTDYSRRFNQGMSFEDTVKEICKVPDELSNLHFRSQVSQITPGEGATPDFIGRLETFKKDWLELGDAIGKQLPSLPWENRTNSGDERVWTDSLREMAYNRYKRDFVFLGYDA